MKERKYEVISYLWIEISQETYTVLCEQSLMKYGTYRVPINIVRNAFIYSIQASDEVLNELKDIYVYLCSVNIPVSFVEFVIIEEK